MTEITFVGDVHSNFSQFVRLTKKRKKTKFFVQVGDFGLFSSKAAAKTDADWKIPNTRVNMESFITMYETDKIPRFKVPVYFMGGVHDDYNIDVDYLATKNIHFSPRSALLGHIDSAVQISCLGGIRSAIKINRDPKTLIGKDRRFFTLEDIENIRKTHDQVPIDILVTHQAAMGCLPIRHNVKREEGSRELRMLLDYIKPRYYIHGHHHHNYVRHEDEFPIIIGLGNFGKNNKSFYTLTI